MSVRLHDRYFVVSDAKLEIGSAIDRIADEHDLTYGEVMSILAEQSASWSRYLVRAERHPDDPDKKGDEA